jgi:nucleoside-diphosphate-sugar epimerase
LKSEGYFVRGASRKKPQFSNSEADEFLICDLRNYDSAKVVFNIPESFDEVYHLAGDTGGALYINCGDNDANSVSNSVSIDINVIKLCVETGVKKLFFSSTACVYRSDKDNAKCIESDVYPALPNNEYGWGKLFSERIYQSFNRNYGINVKIARFHSIIGPESQWEGKRSKAHSALARKVALVENNGQIDVIGDGDQKRTFLFIDDCIDAVRLLMDSDIKDPVNIGSDHLISIKDYVLLLKEISGKEFTINFVEGPVGVKNRECSIEKINKILGWRPKTDIMEATRKTYNWIKSQIEKKK